MICIFNLVLLTSIFAGQVSSTNQPGCLTWEVHAGYLNLTCRLENFFQPVTLIDNHEKAHISCTLKKAKHNIGCIPKKRRKHISFDSSLQTVTFTIKNKYSNYVDGIWKCQQGCYSYETEVSTTKGIIDSTDISLYGELMDDDTERKVKLKCVSCRAPRRNHAEFLINGISDTSIVYNRINGKCIHNNVDCEPHICSCSSNEFMYTFPVTSSYSTDYTCDMIFNDNGKGSKFSKNATLFFNGKDFLGKDSSTEQDQEETINQKTRILHNSSMNTECSCILPDCSKSNEFPIVLTLLIAVIVVVIVLMVFFIYFLITRDERQRKYQEIKYLLIEDSKTMRDAIPSNDHETTRLSFEDYETYRDCSQRNNIDTSSILTEDSGACGTENDDREFQTSIETMDSGISIEGRTIFVRSLDTASGSCEPCHAQDIKTSAMYLCLRCDESMCKSCKINHLAMKKFRDHKILEIASLPEKFRLIQQCPIHEKYDDEYICGQHNTLCCRKCIISKHRKCEDVKTIEDASEGFTKSGKLDSYKKNLQMLVDACESLMKLVDANENRIKEDQERIVSKIKNRREHKNHGKNKNTSVEEELEIQLKKKFDEGKEILHTQRNTISQKQSRIVRIEKVFKWLSKIESPLDTELFLLVQMSQEHLNGIKSDLKKIIRESKTMKLQLTDDNTNESKPFTHTILLQNQPPSYINDLFSRKKMTKDDTENVPTKPQVSCRKALLYHK